MHTRRALEWSCLCFAVVGLVLAAWSAPFAIWRESVWHGLHGGGFPTELQPFARTTDAILGGSIAGKWIASWFVVRHAISRPGAKALLLSAHGVWLALDSALSVALGAYANVWMVNLVPGVLFAALLLAHPGPGPAETQPAAGRAWRALTVVCAATAVLGVVTALAIRAPLFAIYNHHLAARFALPPDLLVVWQRFAYALIGATFAAHFVVLTGALWRWREPWVLRAVVVSTGVWFTVDTAGCALQGAWFNVGLINVPSLIAILLPAWFAHRALGRA